jgi:hypothetical protein
MRVWWFAIGTGVGLALGGANHRVAIGMAVGLALGAVIDVLVRKRRRQSMPFFGVRSNNRWRGP